MRRDLSKIQEFPKLFLLLDFSPKYRVLPQNSNAINISQHLKIYIGMTVYLETGMPKQQNSKFWITKDIIHLISTKSSEFLTRFSPLLSDTICSLTIPIDPPSKTLSKRQRDNEEEKCQKRPKTIKVNSSLMLFGHENKRIL